MKPIAEISLPTHHPAVQSSKPGDVVHMVASRVPDEEMDPSIAKEMMPKGERPMPLTTRFHVTDISQKAMKSEAGESPITKLRKRGERAAGSAARKSPVEALKAARAGRQSQSQIMDMM